MLLFWNSKSADDKAVRAALKNVDRWDGRVSVQIASIRKIAKYGRISRGVDVEQSPTIVIADPDLRAETLVGYVDTTTIDQAVVDAFRNTTGLFKDAYLRKVNGVCTRHSNAFVGDPELTRRRGQHARVQRRGRHARHPGWNRFEADFKAVKAPKKWRAFKSATVADNAFYATWLAVGRARLPRPEAERQPAAGGDRPVRPAAQGLAASATTSAWTPSASRSAAPKAEPGLDSPLVELFREHLEHPAGRGLRPAGGFDGTAGGAACGDLIRVSLRVDGERVAAAGFDASGCGTMTAAGSAAVTLVQGAHVLDAARVGAHAIAAELGGLSPGKFHAADLVADALHGALGAAARAGAALPADPDRTLVAMSGGVDSAVAALLVGENAAAVTLELWADPSNDAEASCCSAHAVRIARSVAHGMGLPHFTLDLRDEFRAGVVDPFLADHAGGLTPNPCVRCNGHVRLDAMLEFADRLGAAHLATGHYARQTDDGLLRAAADPAKDQTYMLAAVSAATLARLRFPLGDLTKPEVRALAAEAELPVASKPESQDLCFLAGTGKAAFLARHGSLPERPGDVVDAHGPRARPPPRPSPVHRRPAARARDRGRRAAVRARQGRGQQPRDRRPARRARDPRRLGPRRPPAPRRRRGRRGQAPLPLAPDRLPRGGRPEPGTHRRLELELDGPVDGAAPGQTACLLKGDVVVGWGTISA